MLNAIVKQLCDRGEVYVESVPGQRGREALADMVRPYLADTDLPLHVVNSFSGDQMIIRTNPCQELHDHHAVLQDIGAISQYACVAEHFIVNR